MIRVPPNFVWCSTHQWKLHIIAGVLDAQLCIYDWYRGNIPSNFDFLVKWPVQDNSWNEVIVIQKELQTILKSVGFELRMWCANHPQLIRHIPNKHKEIKLYFVVESRDLVKTWGLNWLPKEEPSVIIFLQKGNKKNCQFWCVTYFLFIGYCRASGYHRQNGMKRFPPNYIAGGCRSNINSNPCFHGSTWKGLRL